MEVTGKIKLINEEQTFGTSGFRKRECVVTTNETYPQMLMVEFVQDKCDLLNSFKVGDDVKIAINLRGKEWINPEGVAKYFNSINGWKIDKEVIEQGVDVQDPNFKEDVGDDLPF